MCDIKGLGRRLAEVHQASMLEINKMIININTCHTPVTLDLQRQLYGLTDRSREKILRVLQRKLLG